MRHPSQIGRAAPRHSKLLLWIVNGFDAVDGKPSFHPFLFVFRDDVPLRITVFMQIVSYLFQRESFGYVGTINQSRENLP